MFCQRQRTYNHELRGALIRKQSELDKATIEASSLQAELEFIMGDMSMFLDWLKSSSRQGNKQFAKETHCVRISNVV